MKNSIKLFFLALSAFGTAHLHATDPLSPDSIYTDLDSLKTTVSAVHPTHMLQGFALKIDSLKETIQSPISAFDLFRKLQPLIAIDGHTTLQFNNQITPEIDAPFLPLEIVVYHERLFIKQNYSDKPELAPGTEILKINNQSIEILLPQIRCMMQGETDAYKNSRLSGDGFSNWYRLTFGNFPMFNIIFSLKGRVKAVQVTGVSQNTFTLKREPMLSFIKIEDDIALFKVRRFRKPKRFLPLVDSVFTVLQNDRIRHLILDIQGGGGFTDLADTLLSYITDHPYRQCEKRLIKISTETKDYIDDYQGPSSIRDGYFLTIPPLQKPVDRYNRFTGQVYIITGPQAYSTMTLFVAMAKAYTDAFIIGEETGQPLISNGDISRHILPNCRMNYYLSHTIYYMPGAKNTTESVIPHLIAKPDLDDLLQDRDVRLEFALNYIKTIKLGQSNLNGEHEKTGEKPQVK